MLRLTTVATLLLAFAVGACSGSDRNEAPEAGSSNSTDGSILPSTDAPVEETGTAAWGVPATFEGLKVSADIAEYEPSETEILDGIAECPCARVKLSLENMRDDVFVVGDLSFQLFNDMAEAYATSMVLPQSERALKPGDKAVLEIDFNEVNLEGDVSGQVSVSDSEEYLFIG